MVLLPSLVLCEQFEEIRDFSGGLNTRDPSYRLSTSFTPYMRNCTIDEGRVKGIAGFSMVGSSNTLMRVTGIFPYVKEDGTAKFLVTDSSITLETQDFRSWTLVSATHTTTTLITWMQVREKMWGFNGVDAVITWDGTQKRLLDGNGGNANVPKFRYGAYWQEHVFGFNDSDGKSDLDFSSLSSTDGIAIAPDDSRAWPVTNVLSIGQGDGEQGMALWIKNGQLMCGKERGIYTIFGTNVSNYFARKETSAEDGVASNDTVINLDGATYWMGQDGIYKDGERISDLIPNEFGAIERPANNVVQNTWDSQVQFAPGQFWGTTATASGILMPQVANISTTPVYSSGGFFPHPIGGAKILDSGTTFWGPIRVDFRGIIDNSSMFYTTAMNIVASHDLSGCAGQTVLKATVENPFTGVRHSRTVDLGSGDGGRRNYDLAFTSQSPVFEGYKVNVASFILRFENPNYPNCAGGAITINWPTNAGNGQQTPIFFFVPASTVQYISDATTASMVTAWGRFDSQRQTNQGSLAYFIKTATSLVTLDLSTRTWNPISPGAIVPDNTAHRFFQWATTITYVSSSPAVTQIDDVTIDHIEGQGSLNRAFAIGWKGRYLLFTSTGAGDVLSFGLWKSRITNSNPNAWMPVEGIDIRSIAKFRDTLYGGASSTGVIYKMDYGTNFNGTPIPFVYDTPDLLLQSNFEFKNIKGYLLDIDKDSGLTVTLGTSIDGGAFTSKSISLSGNGRALKSIYGVTAPAQSIRLRLSHAQLDRQFRLNDLTVLYDKTPVVPR